MDYVIDKRDGRKQKFDRNKIVNAMIKACEAERGGIDTEFVGFANKVADSIEELVKSSWEVKDHKVLSVEDIQDIIENKLMASRYKDVAKKYILYRNRRTRSREYNADFMKEVTRKLKADVVDNQNANVDERSFGGRKGEAESVLMKKYALDNCVSELAKRRHLNNEIYIHDLDNYAVGMHNCLTIPFDDILSKGFNTRQTDVRPANSINTAFQLVAVVFQLQSLQQFGGVSASHLDWTMVPYVRKSFFKHYINGAIYIGKKDGVWLQQCVYDYLNDPDCFKKQQSIDADIWKKEKDIYQYAMDMTTRELQQAAEGMYHNLNTLQSRSGNQLPFTSINYGTCTLPEGRMVIKALLEGSIKGVGKFHKTSIFPCSIFQCMEGVNRKEGDPNYDLFKLALESTAKRLYPNYANVDWSGNAGYDPNDPRTYFSTMGCRTANGYDINGFGQLKDGRGNICPVTIIMPTLAMEAKEQVFSFPDTVVDEELIIASFMSHLSQAIDDAKDMLIERFEYICSQDPSSAKFMYENGTMAGYIPEEGIRSALKHGTLAIGQIGLAETLQILIGCDHTTEQGMELAKRIEQLFKDRCAEFKEEYKLNFGVYMTPAENLCYTSMKKFQAKYGKIPNISDRDYFTNSIHVPVWKEISPFEKIDIESQLTGYSSAGCITYVEFDSAVVDNITALETVVNYAMDHDIPYFAVNVPNDLCRDCGFTGLIDDACPQCGGKHIDRLRRVTGYLTGDYKTAFNLGKQKEVEDRYKHSQKMRGYKV